MTLLSQIENYILQLEIKIQQLDQQNKVLQQQITKLNSKEVVE